jgi:hypothetical protein
MSESGTLHFHAELRDPRNASAPGTGNMPAW